MKRLHSGALARRILANFTPEAKARLREHLAQDKPVCLSGEYVDKLTGAG
jgi:hypothetical protein